MLPYYNVESYRPYRRNMILKPFWYTSYVYLDICLELRLTDCILLRLLLWHPPYFSLRITFLVTNSFKLSTAIAFSLTLSFRCFYLLWQYIRILIVEPVSRNIQIYQYSNFEQLMVMETLFKLCDVSYFTTRIYSNGFVHHMLCQHTPTQLIYHFINWLDFNIETHTKGSD